MMSMNLKDLPDEPEQLKALILKLESEHQKQVEILTDEIAYWKRKLFNPKSEKYTPLESQQAQLFDEIESESTPLATEVEAQIHIDAYSRRRGTRKALPETLPRKEIIHDLKAEEKLCACGARLQKIGEELSEKLDIIPAKIVVEKHIRYKYACKACAGLSEPESGAVKTAALPPQLLPKTLATPGLLAYLLTAKFTDGLPFYRVEKILLRLGIELSRQTMARWAISVRDRLRVLLNILRAELLSGPLIGIDESTIQVLKETDRSAQTLSYMWVYRGGKPEHPVLLFEYRQTRAGQFLIELLKDYQGYIQCDAFSGYNHLAELKELAGVAGCWAHVRRKFFDAEKASKKKGSAHYAVEKIKELYKLDKKLKAEPLTAQQIAEQRCLQLAPLLSEFKTWLEEKKPQVPPESLLGKAINYTLTIWDKLLVFLKDAAIPLDNNLVENAIRPFALGRKSWLFADTPAGAHASAAFYSLIETAKANQLEPYWYLRYLFHKISEAETEEDFKALLPQYVDPAQLKTV